MKICFVSDLHVDSSQAKSIVWEDADLLIIAGDTANTIGAVIKTMDKVSKRFKQVLMVDGNHCHYSNANQKRLVKDTLARIRELLPENVKLLSDMESLKIGDHYFIGANGWYSFDCNGEPTYNKSKYMSKDSEMNDNLNIGFSNTVGMQPMPWELADIDANNIRSKIVDTINHDPSAKFVIVTHTVPHRSLVSQRPEDLSTNCYYVNTRMEAIIEEFNDRIDYWAYGHTHYRSMKRIGNIEFVANPRGYGNQNSSWEPIVFDV